ncbi:MAG: sugar phosphate isomerase/epimerase [Butyrivibrio sp.]|nr:sugar phosphate isomerase/epimerase [Butyrivibrio sp.]
MQIGIRFHDTVDLPIEERVIETKKQGFSCVHIALGKTTGQTAEPEALTPGYAAYLRRVFDKAELDIAVLGCYLNLATPDPAALAATQEKYKAHIRFAAQLGCGMVGTETGAPNTDYHYDKEACHSEEALRQFITNLRPVVRYAEQMGVIFAIEPVYRHIVWNPVRARIVLDAIDSPNLQIIFDAVNLLNPDNYDRKQDVIREAIEVFGRDVAMIHLKDCLPGDPGTQNVKSVPCGKGELDYTDILRFARDRKPWIQATLEDTKPDNAVAAREFIEGKMASL